MRMMKNYSLQPTRVFSKNYERILKYSIKTADRIDLVLKRLQNNPFQSGLRTHRIRGHRRYGSVWSSRATGDIRVLWTFDENDDLLIILLDVGGHDEVY